MIPNRHKTEQSGVGNFTVEHQQTQRQVGAALQVSGNTVIVASEQPGLTAYYVARILKQLSTMERNLAPRVRKLPADRDALGARAVGRFTHFTAIGHHVRSTN